LFNAIAYTHTHKNQEENINNVLGTILVLLGTKCAVLGTKLIENVRSYIIERMFVD
jgi:hypothetical protein